jgi:general stress protein CsbA
VESLLLLLLFPNCSYDHYCGYLFVSSLIVLQEDPVLLVPEDKEQKPYVAIIKVTHIILVPCVLCVLFAGYASHA